MSHPQLVTIAEQTQNTHGGALGYVDHGTWAIALRQSRARSTPDEQIRVHPTAQQKTYEHLLALTCPIAWWNSLRMSYKRA
eukprot:5865440-Lingulodinium_polyedra.AAC.1